MNNDTLDYLIPSVRKRIVHDELKEEHNLTGEVPRNKLLSTRLAKYKTQFSQSVKTDIVSFTGIKQTASKVIGDQLTVSNCNKKKTKKNIFTTNDKDHKFPISSSNIIKITVVPIAKVSSKTVLKRKQIEQKIHKTVSNANTSIKTHIFTLAKHRQPTHNIRETSSVDLFKPKWERNHDKTILNRMTYAKTIIGSLNMNHKEKQGRASKEFRETQVSPKSNRKSYQAAKEGCICDNTKINNVLDDMNARKDRLTIVGRLGVNENDQYVLNCAATVNNKSIGNYISQKVSSASIDDCANDREVNKISKATQADINVCFANNKTKNTNENKKNIQCYCKDATTNISEHKLKQYTEQKSPLIVISVYPTKDTIEGIKDLGELIQIKQLPEPQQSVNNPIMNIKAMEPKGESTAFKKNTIRTPEKRSTFPPMKSSNKIPENRTHRNRSPITPINNKVENRSPRSRSRSRSPPVKINERENNKNSFKKYTIQKSVRNPDRQSRQPTINKVLVQKDKPNRNSVIVNAALSSKINPSKSSYEGIKDTISKKNKIKKAIVDSYTQKVLMTDKGKDALRKVEAKPASNASSVTVNIDGDNERYRLLFLQDKLNTDLHIRKTLKTHQQNLLNELKNKNRVNDEDLMGNYNVPKKVVPGKNLNRLSKQINNSQDLSKCTGGLKIRDSLEICNWREKAEDNQNIKDDYKNYEPTVRIMHKTANKYSKNEDVSVKHYRGDQCCVPSPALRDQEIRDLLGIKRPRSGKSEFVQEVLPELIGQKLHFTLHPEKWVRSNSSRSIQCKRSLNKIENKINISDQPKSVHTSTQCEESIMNSNKQMVLNRNIQVFLQVEQFTKQKPIMLSRKQYEKVKKTIKKKISKKFSQERHKVINSTKCSLVSIGDIRKTRKQRRSNAKICRTVQVENNSMLKQESDCNNNHHEDHKPSLPFQNPENTTKDDMHNINESPRQVVSSTEIHYASLAHLRHVTFSSSNLKNDHGSPIYLKQKNCPSIQIIYKGPKKCATPNLGTSAYSLYSDEELEDSDNKYAPYPYDEKPKKPFLRRLMSCLVMRSNRASEAILPRQCDKPCFVNSFDSYHINTSLGGIELTSSLYDTSASFYSNHTILPITKMKRGFLSSVRGFLTNLKSR